MMGSILEYSKGMDFVIFSLNFLGSLMFFAKGDKYLNKFIAYQFMKAMSISIWIV